MAKLSNRIKTGLDASGSLVPVGTIIAYMPGYFGALGNGGGWTAVGPAGNSVAQVNTYLPSNWRVCNGSEPNDPDSPIFNTLGRFLPELTGERFVMGNVTAGTAAGNASNQVTLTTTQLPSHNHPATVTVASDAAPHAHPLTIAADNAPHAHPLTIAADNAPHAHGVTDPGHQHVVNQTGTLSPGGSPRPYEQTGTFSSGYATTPNTTGVSVNPANAPHQHPGSTVNANNAPHQHPGSTVNANSVPHTHPGSTASTGPAGTGSAFDIRPLYLTAFYIMRIK